MTDSWYQDWQHERHAVAFDHRVGFDVRNLIRNLEGFNDVRLLNERLDPSRAVHLLEVGCATGEFSRYLKVKFPRVRYTGIDISRAAIARAKAKYPEATFFIVDPLVPLEQSLHDLGLSEAPDMVFAKDVVHHQTQPFAFLSQLVTLGREAILLRTRTRDVGTTELDPEQSCQYHYGGWMPYLVLNLQELVDHIVRLVPGCELIVYRHHTVLGGQHNRFLPRALYLKDTGTAETAVGVFKRTDHPGRVTIADRPDQNPVQTWDYALKHAARQAWQALRPCAARDAGSREGA